MSKLIHYSGPAGSILLPSGYTRLSYIQSTGTQWIDTGYKVSGNGTLVVQGKVLATNTLGERDWIGNYNGKGFVTGLYNSNQYSYKENNNSIGSICQGTFNANQIYDHLAIYDALQQKLITNGATYTAPHTGNVASSQNITLFRRGDNNFYWIGRIYKATIWFNDQIVRDFVPVKRTTDNEIGMLDLCNNIFYGSQSDIFIAGPEIPQGFPTSEYCQVEWLESTGKQKLQITGLTATANDQFGINVMVANTTENKDKSFTVKSESNQFQTYGYSYDATNKTIINCSSVGGETIHGGWIIPYGSFVQAELSTTTCGTETLNRPLTDNVTTLTIMEYSSCRIAYFKVSHKNTVIHNLIPCYRRSDMKPGMYDLISRTFLTNQGTGEFLLGPSITFGWGEIVNNVGAEAHPMLGTQYTETNKFTHTGNRKDAFRILPVYQRVEPGQQISISFDTDVTQWASGHDVSGGTINKGKWTMWIYFSKVYNTNGSYDRFACYAASQIKSLGGTRWKYSFTVPADMHMITVRTNLYSDGSTTYTAHFWNFNWSFGDTGCQVNPLHAIPYNISTGDGRNGEKNGAFDRGHIKTQGLESLKTSNWTIACWLYPLATSPTGGSAFLGLGSTINGALVVESNRYFSYNTMGTARIGNPSLENNKWTHIAFVNNGNTIKYYKNGIYVNEIDSTNIVDTGELWVGSRCFGGEVNCRFQDIQVWDEIKNPAELM